MTDEEWAELATRLWLWCWPYGTQQDRAELLAIKARIEAAMSLNTTITDIPAADVSLNADKPD